MLRSPVQKHWAEQLPGQPANPALQTRSAVALVGAAMGTDVFQGSNDVFFGISIALKYFDTNLFNQYQESNVRVPHHEPF